MKNYFAFIFALVLMSCSSDDSTSLSPNNTPSGALTKVEAYFPTNDYNVSSNYIYGLSGKINSAVSTSIQPGFPNTINTVNYLVNSEGQVWKLTSSYSSQEFQFSNGLIVSSIQTIISTGTITTGQYTYNSDNELIKAESFDENGVSGLVVIYTYDANGNILTTNRTASNGNMRSYTYEYDTNPSAMSKIYANQEFGKILEASPNNKTKRTYNNNGVITVFTAEYTYNTDGYPITETEFQNGNTLVEETTFTYQL